MHDIQEVLTSNQIVVAWEAFKIPFIAINLCNGTGRSYIISMTKHGRLHENFTDVNNIALFIISTTAEHWSKQSQD